MTEHPQVLIDLEGTTADENIAPLVKAARDHNLNPTGSCQGGGEGDYALAYITFQRASEALEFLNQSGHFLSFQIGDQMALSVHRPLYGGIDEPGGKVFWNPGLTPALISAWTATP